MDLPELSGFYLAGGTALALQYGHRRSIDLDLFSSNDFDTAAVIPVLEKNFKDFTYRSTNNSIGLFGFVGDVKVDFVRYHYHPLIASSNNIDGIRLLSIPDIIAMKINAIMKRGVKKDFWDIAELLKHYTIENFITFYNKKYPSQQLLISIPQALTYFEDAEQSEDPVSLKGQSWESVKTTIQQKVSAYLR